jgi:hypothetical protein
VKEPKAIVLGGDGTGDIFVDQSWVNKKAFGEEANTAAIVCESCEGDSAILPDVAKSFLIHARQSRSSTEARVDCLRGPLPELCITVMLVVEALEDP